MRVFIFVFFLLMSLAALVGGSYIVVKTIRLKTSGTEVTARFLRYEESVSTRNNDNRSNGVIQHHFHRVYAYRVGSETREGMTRSAPEETDLSPGDEAVIVYDPSDPGYIEEAARLNKSLVAGFICFGLGALVLFLTFFIRRQLRASTN